MPRDRIKSEEIFENDVFSDKNLSNLAIILDQAYYNQNMTLYDQEIQNVKVQKRHYVQKDWTSDQLEGIPEAIGIPDNKQVGHISNKVGALDLNILKAQNPFYSNGVTNHSRNTKLAFLTP